MEQKSFTSRVKKKKKKSASPPRQSFEWHPFCPQMVSLNGPETGTCVEATPGSQYSIKVRAKPIGTIYSGHWSDWSDVLTGDTPADRGKLELSAALP